MLSLRHLVLLTLVLRLPSLAIPFWNKDEGWNAARAISQAAGGRFYIDAYDHKTPLLYYLHGWVFSLADGHWRMFVIRCCYIAAVTATGLALAVIGRQLVNRRTGLFAFFLFTVFQLCWIAEETYYAGTENFMNAPLAWAVALFLCAGAAWEQGRRVAGLVGDVGAGLCIAIGVLFRNSALPDLAVLLCYLCCDGWARQRIGRNSQRMGAVGVGFVIPCAITVAYLLAAGTWAEARFWNVDFVRLFLLHNPGPWEFVRRGVTKTAMIVGSQLLLYALAAAWVWSWLRTLVRDRAWRANIAPRSYPLFWCLGGCTVILAGGRFSTHYYFQLLPALAVLAAMHLDRVWDGVRERTSVRRALAVAMLLPLAGFGTEIVYRIGHYHGWIGSPSPGRAVAEYVQTHTSPSDRIVVWGYLPEVYYFADRVSATRFHTITHLTGQIREEVTYSTELPQLQKLWRDFWAEMHAHPPVLFIDTSQSFKVSGRFMHSVERYPALMRWLGEHYRHVTTIGHAIIYQRL